MAAPDIDHPVVLFDGVCNLCSDYVQFLLERDDAGRLRFASLQSPPGERLLASCGYEADPLAGIVLVDQAGCHRKSDAVIRIAQHLGAPYSILRLGRVIPRRLRDWLYDVVANRRYQWFGTREECLRPTPERESRFLDDGMYPPAKDG